MCGISGLIYMNKGIKYPENYLKKMTERVSHRGPDGNGIYTYQNVGFGHTRLSIIDLSKKGRQPMNYKNKYTITYNGEIYNYKELRDKLTGMGYKFSNETDTEVILAAYDHWGQKCVEKFNGMWAFAIHDKDSEIIFLSRDRFGIKPLYYLSTGDKFLFGSEIKQLLQFSNRKANFDRIYDYLILSKDEHDSHTFFSDIFKVPSGSNMVYDLKKNYFKIIRYYSIKIFSENKNLKLEKSYKGFKDLLYKSIKLRLRSDVEVGSCLSGGLDSSAIVSVVSSINKGISSFNLKTFHAKFLKSPSTDESDFVKMISSNLPIKSNIIEIDDNDIINLSDESIKIQEEPFLSPSVILQLIIMRESKKNNCKVLLDGQGGDEVLLGYERYFSKIIFDAKWNQKLGLFFNFSRNSKLKFLDLIKYYLYFNINLVRTFLVFKRSSFILKSKEFKKWKKNSKPFFKRSTSIVDLQKNEITDNQLPHLLRYEDKNSMSCSVETRLPFLDYRLVEYVLSIPSALKVSNGWSKYILRKSMEDELPYEICWRKNKLGFELNEKKIMDYLEEDFYEILSRSDLSKSLFDYNVLNTKFTRLSSRYKWRLYNILKWEEIFQIKT